MMLHKQPTILLTFDVEEFDLPLEYKIPIDAEEQFSTGKQGLDEIEKLLKNHAINTTMFTTARFAIKYQQTIKDLSYRNEIASHSFNHTSFEKADLSKSKIALENITGKGVKGFRMPRMKKINIDWIIKAGYTYDSSINPTFIPGRYNNRHLPRVFYKEKDIILRLPTSVTPNLRIPLFWLAFKNFPYGLYKTLALQTLKKDGYLSLYFHNWEFTDVSKFPLPPYLIRHSGNALLEKMNTFITDFKNEAEFATIENYIQKNAEILSL